MASQLTTSIPTRPPGGKNSTAEKLLVAARELMNEGASIVAPLLEFQRRLLAEGIKAGEFRNIDPVMFYTSLVGACDHLFFGRHAMSRATGVGPVTDEVCREYIKHMEALICGGMLNGKEAG